MHNRQKGKVGEDQAVVFLEHLGFKIEHRNYYVGRTEFDIIAINNDSIRFVEVKMINQAFYGPAAMKVTQAKVRRHVQASTLFLANHPEYSHLQPQMDVIAISHIDGHYQIDHYENITQLSSY